MPFQGLPWTEFISCPVCFVLFNERQQRPISLGCGHTVCKSCIKSRLTDNRCPFDQSLLPSDVDKLPANFALMHLVGAAVPEQEKEAVKTVVTDNPKSYEQARKCIEDMAVHLKPLAENASDDDSSTCSEQSPSKSNNHTAQNSSSISKCVLSRQMQRKLISLIHCQLLEEEGRSRATRIARSLGERIVSELLVLHQYPHQLSANLWAAVRTRGCQFLGPAMQEEVIKLILLALEDGSFLSRKVLVLFVVQRLESRYPQASKTAIGHVVQLLYRASCFKVLKREEESSLMQLKEEFRQYESLRREHDSQIVQIALEAGLRISPEQWSSLLYGDPAHKSHMQSIIDKHQSPQSFAQSVTELMLTLQRSNDHTGLLKLHPQLEFLSNIDPSPDCPAPSWENLEAIMRSLNTVMSAFVEFLSNPDHRSRLETTPVQSTRYKTSLCRDFTARGTCPRGNTCTFAHSQDELERYRSRSRRSGSKGTLGALDKDSSPLTPSECDQLRQVQLITKQKAEAAARNGQTPGNTQPFIEQLDHQHAAASSSRVFPPVFSSLPLTQPPPHITGLLHPKGPLARAIEMMGTQPLEQEKVQFMSPAPQLVPETHLTFSCPGVDGSDNPNVPTLGPQAYFHPNSPNTYQHNPLLQQPMGHSPLMRPQPPYIPTQGMHLMLQPPFPPRSLTRPPSHQSGSLANGNTVLQALPQPLQAGEISVNMPPPSSADAALIYRGCHPCVPVVPPGDRPQMVPYTLQGGESLEKLTSRKQQIINHLQDEPMFMGSGASRYLADSQRGFAGLKTVLSTNKHRRQAMPKSVSDMFVVTRSTQSLDELLNDDVQNYTIKWSNGDDHLSDVTANEFLESSLRGSLPESCTTNSVSFSMTATTTSGAADMAGNGHLFTSEEDSAGNISVSTTQAVCSSDAEFCSFPNDDGDETIIPFEHTSVSRFGPISRMSKAKMYNSAPVQVTADSYKWMTPVLSMTPLDRPLATTMQMPTRFAYRGMTEMLKTEPSVKPTPLEAPSIWQQTPLPSYHNIARMKAGAAEAVTNNERLAYELQAVELEIAMKTGKEPESFTKIIQDAVVAPSEYRPSSDLTTSSNGVLPGNKDNMMKVETSQSLSASQQLGHNVAGDYSRSWPGVKK